MAVTPEQVASMLEMMQKQMSTIESMQKQNVALNKQLTSGGSSSQPNDDHSGGAKPKRPPPKRPSIESNMSDTDWAIFEDAWNRYKQMAKLSEVDDINLELRAACSDEVNKLLFEYVGPDELNKANVTEDALKTHIKRVAVKGKAKEVHRMMFGKLNQSVGESITHFVAKLKSQAMMCSFTVECTCKLKVTFLDEMIKQQLVAGLRNVDHQAKILSEAQTLNTLDAIINRLVGLETTEEASSSLGNTQTTQTAATKSKYKTQQKIPGKEKAAKPTMKDRPCRGCGKGSHGPGKSMNRKDCPLYDHRCSNCNILGHDVSVCERSKSSASHTSEEHGAIEDRQNYSSEANSVSFSFAGIPKAAPTVSIASDLAQPHLCWNKEADSFQPHAPPPSPIMMVTVRILTDVHKRYGRPVEEHTSIVVSSQIEAIADTGCQTCTSGSKLLKHLKVPLSYLIPTRHRIIGITDTTLEIKGALMLAITFNGNTCNQMVYIAGNASGLYLSEASLKDLGVITRDFPNTPLVLVMAALTNEADGTKCPCIPRAEPPSRPETIPLPPTEDNILALENWLLQTFMSSAFNTCTHQLLQSMSGTPVRIKFKKNILPYAVHKPIPVPHHWEEVVKEGIDRDIRLGVIEPVPQGTPTEWCARMVVVPKPDGTPRRTVDLQKLNEATLRETHHTPTPFKLVSTIPPNTLKTVCDAWNGYHSLELAKDSKNVTAFITPWGRYRYRRAPMGMHTSGDAYTRRFDDITAEVPRSVRCVDDTLLWNDTVEDAFWHTFDYLHLCASNGLVFNTNKFKFARSIVEFAGFEVTPTGYRPPERIIAAIRDFPVPENITDARSWFGLVNQVAYAFAQAKVMEPFRQLLVSKNRTWPKEDTNLREVFNKSKDVIIRQIQDGVQAFEKNRTTCLATDWSKTGIGFVLTQKHCRCTDTTPNCGQGTGE